MDTDEDGTVIAEVELWLKCSPTAPAPTALIPVIPPAICKALVAGAPIVGVFAADNVDGPPETGISRERSAKEVDSNAGVAGCAIRDGELWLKCSPTAPAPIALTPVIPVAIGRKLVADASVVGACAADDAG